MSDLGESNSSDPPVYIDLQNVHDVMYVDDDEITEENDSNTYEAVTLQDIPVSVPMECRDKLLNENSDSDMEICFEQQPASFSAMDSTLKEHQQRELTDKFLNGELTFSEYAALMDENDLDSLGKQSNVLDIPSGSSVEPTEPSSIDAFERELKAARKQQYRRKGFSSGRRRRTLPQALQGLMGEANLRFARGDHETAIKMCMEIIRQVPTAPEPFQTLATLYEELGSADKSLQFSLIAAHLSPHDAEEWIHLAVMSQEQNNVKQAITCYAKAINADPTNIDVHITRCNLLEEIGERKAALKGYQRVLQIMRPDQGQTCLHLAKMIARMFHEGGELNKAKEAMETAFAKCPNDITSEDVNLMLELLLSLKEYARSLEILHKHCGVEVALSEDTDDSTTEAETVRRVTVLSCKPPSTLPVDLKAKLVITLIHLKALDFTEDILKSLLQESPEDVGDLYLDIAEALMSVNKYKEAISLLSPLVESQKYSLAAVWLRYAECLQVCEQFQSAVDAYKMVIQLAPQHLEARLSLSGLLQQLGRSEEALTALMQDAEQDVLDPSLLYKQCQLLLGENRMDEFLETGKLLFSRHFRHIRDMEETRILTSSQRLSRKSESLRAMRNSRGDLQDDGSHSFSDGNVPLDGEWSLFISLCRWLLTVRRYDQLQRVTFSALGSARFQGDVEKSKSIDFYSLLSCFYNGDGFNGYNLARELVLKDMNNNKAWNLFNLIISRADDQRHNKFLMRLLTRNQEHVALRLLHAHNCLVAGTYKYSLSAYATDFKLKKTPLLALLLGLTLVHMACQKFSAKKHALVTQALAFLGEYEDLRGTECYHEIHYNIGRAFHQLGILPSAIHHYRKVLEWKSDFVEEHSHLFDLRRETAFNLYLIYYNSGARDIARSIIDEYIVV